MLSYYFNATDNLVLLPWNLQYLGSVVKEALEELILNP